MYAPQSPDSVAAPSVLARDETSGLLYDAEHWYLEDGVTVVQPDPDNPGYARDAAGNLYHLGKPADAATALFDRESGRWRRRLVSGEFEYHHDADQAWERRGEHSQWLRLHEGTGAWLAYDAPSQTWLYEGRWLPGDSIGAPEAGEDTARGSGTRGHRDPSAADRAADDRRRGRVDRVAGAGGGLAVDEHGRAPPFE